MTRLLTFLREVPTTNMRIVFTLVFLVLPTAVRFLWRGPVEGGEWNAWLVFLCVFAGIDAAQYLSKRLTHRAEDGTPSLPPTPAAPATYTPPTQAPDVPRDEPRDERREAPVLAGTDAPPPPALRADD